MQTATIDASGLRAELDELRDAHNALSGAVFAHSAIISILIGGATRNRQTAERITERFFMDYLAGQDQLVAPLGRKTALVTFRSFVVDAQKSRMEHVAARAPRRPWLQRLIGG